jgi:hypothetical protein
MTIDATKAAVLWRRLFGARKPVLQDGEGALLGTSDRGREVRWPPPSAERASHGDILAGSGAGKTILAQATIVSEIAASRRAPASGRMAVVAVDPKGDLSSGTLDGVAAECPEALTDLSYLNPFAATGGFPFNLAKLDLGQTPPEIWALLIAGLVGTMSTSVGDQKHLSIGARQMEVLQAVTLAVIDCPHPRANFLWAIEALSTGEDGIKRLAKVTKSERARQFLTSNDIGDELRSSCASRCRMTFALTDGLAAMTSAPNCISPAELTGPGRLTVFDGSGAPAGMVLPTTFFSNVFLRLVTGHLFERTTPWRGHHARLWIDEAQIVAQALSEVLERILTTGRSFGLSSIVASQGTALLKAAGGDTLLRVMMTNTPLKLIGRLSAPDAELLAREQAPASGVDSSISEVRSRFIGAVTNLKDREFLRLTPGQSVRFRSRDVDLDAWHAAAERHAGALRAARSRYVLPRDLERAPTLAEVARLDREATSRGRSRGAAPADSAPEPERETPKPKTPGSRWG